MELPGWQLLREFILPKDYRIGYPTCGDALAAIVDNRKNAIASSVLFWTLYTQPKLIPLDPDLLGELEDLQRFLHSEYEADANIDKEGLFVYLHVSGSLAALNERSETAYSKSFFSVLENIFLTANRYNDSVQSLDALDEKEKPLDRSLAGLLGIATAWYFEYQFRDRNYLEALHAFAVTLTWMAAAGLQVNRGFHGPDVPIDEDQPIEALERLCEKVDNAPLAIKDWASLAEYCETIANEWESCGGDSGCLITWKGEKKRWNALLNQAIGFCKCRSSFTEPEQRPKIDFSDPLWEGLEDVSKRILVELETDWVNKRVSSMMEKIRQLLEAEVIATFKFLASIPEKRNEQLVLTRCADLLRRDNLFVDGLRINDADKAWATGKLPEFLFRVKDARNHFSKEDHLHKYLPIKKERQPDFWLHKATEIHDELLDIGGGGMLPRLLRVRKTINTR